MRKHITVLCITAATLVISSGLAAHASAAMVQAGPMASQAAYQPSPLEGFIGLLAALLGGLGSGSLG
jgi:hypothetical protein